MQPGSDLDWYRDGNGSVNEMKMKKIYLNIVKHRKIKKERFTYAAATFSSSNHASPPHHGKVIRRPYLGNEFKAMLSSQSSRHILASAHLHSPTVRVVRSTVAHD